MPLVVPCELPTADIAVVFPPGGGRVMVLVDSRVPFAIAADVIDRVRDILHCGRGAGVADLAEFAQGCVYALPQLLRDI